jgi:hypothetical protein
MSSSSGQGLFHREHFWGFRPFKRHGLVLVVAGLSYILYGLIYILAEPTENRKIALQIAFDWFPIEFWGSVFIIIGVLSIISSRWPPVLEMWGYALLSGLSCGWAATYAAGVIFEDSPISNLTGTLNWGLLAFLWIAISGFVSPDKTVVVVIKDDGSPSDC